MKKFLIIFLFHLIFCSITNSNDLMEILELETFQEQYNSLLEAFKTLESIESTEDKKFFGELLSDVIRILINKHRENSLYVKKLEELLSRFNKYSFMNIAISGFYHLDKSIVQLIHNINIQKYEEFSNFLGKIKNANINPKFKFLILNKLFKKNYDAIKSMNILSDKAKIIFQNFRQIGNLISLIYNTLDKFSKCELKGPYAFIISYAQGMSKVGTSIIFGSLGSFFGTFIPIPFVGTFIGGVAGNYIGNKINSLYDINC